MFKTAKFSKDAKKSRISDMVLCGAILQVQAGQADDLGGGVFKKRLQNNQQRAIIITKTGEHWVYEYLFAKQDRANISEAELAAFKMLAKAYISMTDLQLDVLLEQKDLMEICHDQD